MMEARDNPLPLIAQIKHGSWVGRQREMAEALTLWRYAISGEAQVLCIRGEPGVGKTRFVRELSSEVLQTGAFVLSGECYADGTAPYAPIAQIIRNIIDKSTNPGLQVDEEILNDLASLIPSLNSRSARSLPNQALDPQSMLQRILDSFIMLSTGLLAQAPLFLFFDDVHWADSTTLTLLKGLIRRLRRSSLMLVLTYREAELDSAPDLERMLIDLHHERLAMELNLSRLDREETRELLAEMFAEEITSEFLDGIYKQTDGNPFFVEEICKALIESGDLVFQDDHWQRPAMSSIRLPMTIRSTILSRIEKLPTETQETLRMAAILGGEFDFMTLKLATGFQDEVLISALENAVQARLISEIQTGNTVGARFNFVHVLIPTSLQESIIHVRRRLLHEHAARAIEAVRPDDFEALAYQYKAAGNNPRAKSNYLHAGDRAQWVAPYQAIQDYKAALDLIPQDATRERADTLAHLGYCLWVTGDVQGSLNVYQTAYALFEQLGEPTHGGEMQRMIGRMYWENADHNQARKHYFQALSILEKEPESPALARAISSIAQMYMVAHEDDQAIAWGKRALELAKRLGTEEVIVHAMNNLGSSYAQIGDFETGIQILEEDVQRALAANLPQDVCRAYYNLAVALQRQCRYTEAVEVYQALYPYATKVYSNSYSHLALWRLMWLQWTTGQWKTALEYRSRMGDFSPNLYSTWENRIFGQMDLELGRVDLARRKLEESLDVAVQAAEPQTTAPHLGLLLRVYVRLGEKDKADELSEQVISFILNMERGSTEFILPLTIACHWLANQKDSHLIAKARACLDRLQKLAQQYHIAESGAALLEAQASLMQAEGEMLGAADLFQKAAAEWGIISRFYDQAQALGYSGDAYTQAGKAATARLVYEQALQIYASLSEQLDADDRTEFLDSQPVRSVRACVQLPYVSQHLKKPKPTLGHLTEREVEVLQLVAEGLTNAQIAGRLYLSPLTINAHLRSIFNKLDVATRTAAVHTARQHKLI